MFFKKIDTIKVVRNMSNVLTARRISLPYILRRSRAQSRATELLLTAREHLSEADGSRDVFPFSWWPVPNTFLAGFSLITQHYMFGS